MADENQKSVTDWCDEHYPGADVPDGLRHLFEEATELAAVTDRLTLDDLLDVVRKSWEKSQKDRGDASQVAGEIGDVRISVQWLASKLGIDEQQALNDKMAANRRKTVEESQTRLRKKDNIYRQP